MQLHQERYGEQLGDMELLDQIDKEWLVTTETVFMVDDEDVWCVSRHPLNQRGDEAFHW